MLEIFECEMRRLQRPSHELINQLGEQADATELGGKLSWALAERLHITLAPTPVAASPRRPIWGRVER